MDAKELIDEIIAPTIANYVKEARTENEKLRERVDALEKQIALLRGLERGRAVRERIADAADDDD